MDTGDIPEVDAGQLVVVARLTSASNAVFVVEDSVSGNRYVYKPIAGERPLWDFPTGTLGHREVAAHTVSTLLNWECVPPTSWLPEGPLGAGMLQQWVDGSDDFLVRLSESVEPGHIVIAEGGGENGESIFLSHANMAELQRIVIFDAIVNNADRKGGHVIVDGDGHVWGIDHGVCFSTETKLRTVLWGWTTAPIPAHLADELRGALETWHVWEERLDPWLSKEEVAATGQRLRTLVEQQTFPTPSPTWPALPWPVM